MQQKWCWRCRAELPMLDEHEWARLDTALAEFTTLLDRQLKTHSAADVQEVLAQADPERVLQLYFDLTGFRENNIESLRHHRIGLYGKPCSNCGKPLRTQAARFCAECGTTADDSPMAALPTPRELTA